MKTYLVSEELLRQVLDALDRSVSYMETPLEERTSQPYVEAEDSAIALRNLLASEPKEPEQIEYDITKCPNCGGFADNGHDRCFPPNPYYCSKCMEDDK